MNFSKATKLLLIDRKLLIRISVYHLEQNSDKKNFQELKIMLSFLALLRELPEE